MTYLEKPRWIDSEDQDRPFPVVLKPTREELETAVAVQFPEKDDLMEYAVVLLYGLTISTRPKTGSWWEDRIPCSMSRNGGPQRASRRSKKAKSPSRPRWMRKTGPEPEPET